MNNLKSEGAIEDINSHVKLNSNFDNTSVVDKSSRVDKQDSIGYAAFFSHRKIIEILFEDQISDHNSFRKYTREIKHRRNILIYLTIFQIFAALLGMLILIMRRSFIYILISLLAMILAFCGLNGAIKVNPFLLIIHCVFTTSVTGGFFLYQLLDLFFGSDTTYGNNLRFSDHLILFIFSLPYLFDTCVGIYNYLFLKRIADFNSNQNRNQELLKNEVESIKHKYSEEQINNYISGVDNKLCVICMSNSRNTVLNPCGHVLCCEECAKSIFDKQNIFHEANCPICQRKCSNYLKMYIS